MNLFMELLNYTMAMLRKRWNWLTQLDRETQLTNNEYGIGDFIEDLKNNGYIKEKTKTGLYQITAKTEQTIRKRSLDEIFGKAEKKANRVITVYLRPGRAMNWTLRQGATSLEIHWIA